jgi:hypothetical protein
MSERDSNLMPGQIAFRLPPGAIALALLLKYIGLFLFGIHATWVLVPSFVAVGGDWLSLGWSASISALAALAAAGLARSWRSGLLRLETWTTGVLVLGFLGYTIVLIVRGVLLGSWGGIAVAWLPAILMVFPTIRYFWLVSRQ